MIKFIDSLQVQSKFKYPFNVDASVKVALASMSLPDPAIPLRMNLFSSVVAMVTSHPLAALCISCILHWASLSQLGEMSVGISLDSLMHGQIQR